MTIEMNELMAILAIAAGIGVLAFPKFMRYIVGAFLIIFGISELGIINL